MSANKLAQEAVEQLVADKCSDAARRQKNVTPSLDATNTQTGTAPVAASARAIESAVTALVRYIPTEIITLYIAAVSVAPALNEAVHFLTPRALYWSFVLLTPIMFMIVFLNRLAIERQKFPGLRQFPWWKLMSSTAAFAVWALAVPNNPYIDTVAASAAAGLAALLASTILTLLEPIVEWSTREVPVTGT